MGRTQRLCAWCGIATMVALSGGLLVAGLLPPPAPTAEPGEIARLYQENPLRFRLGIYLALLGGSGLYAPFVSAIFVQLRRIEGPSAPLSYTWLISGAVFILLFGLVFMAMAAAAFRPGGRSAESLQLLTDLSWLSVIGIAAPATVSVLAIGMCVLGDRRTDPELPRWVGYFNLWCAALFFPGTLDIFFLDGPFAYNGLLAFWIPIATFGVWFVVMTTVLLRAVSRQQSAALAR